MARMSLLHQVFGLVITTTILVTCVSSQACTSSIRDYNGCQIFSFSGKCHVETNNIAHKSFYFKPGPTFQYLKYDISLNIADLFGNILYNDNLGALIVKKDTLSDPDKWYYIQYNEGSKNYGTTTTYSLYINNQLVNTLSPKVLYSERPFYWGNKFSIYIMGSSYYAPRCNPNNHHPPPTTPPRRPQIPPPINPPRRPQPITTTQPQKPPEVLTSRVWPPTSTPDTAMTENGATNNTNTGNSEEIDTSAWTEPYYLGLSWPILAIIGACGLLIITIFPVVIVVVVRRRKQHGDKKNLTKNEESEMTDHSFNRQTNPPGQDDDDPENHIYEEVYDQGGPVIYRDPPTRGSVHDSENSIYVPFDFGTTEQGHAQWNGSVANN